MSAPWISGFEIVQDDNDRAYGGTSIRFGEGFSVGTSTSNNIDQVTVSLTDVLRFGEIGRDVGSEDGDLPLVGGFGDLSVDYVMSDGDAFVRFDAANPGTVTATLPPHKNDGIARLVFVAEVSGGGDLIVKAPESSGAIQGANGVGGNAGKHVLSGGMSGFVSCANGWRALVLT